MWMGRTAGIGDQSFPYFVLFTLSVQTLSQIFINFLQKCPSLSTAVRALTPLCWSLRSPNCCWTLTHGRYQIKCENPIFLFSSKIRGFQALVEQEWICAGHPFSLRCAHSAFASGSVTGPHEAPVFLCFLDCVWQVKKSGKIL